MVLNYTTVQVISLKTMAMKMSQISTKSENPTQIEEYSMQQNETDAIK